MSGGVSRIRCCAVSGEAYSSSLRFLMTSAVPLRDSREVSAYSAMPISPVLAEGTGLGLGLGLGGV